MGSCADEETSPEGAPPARAPVTAVQLAISAVLAPLPLDDALMTIHERKLKPP